MGLLDHRKAHVRVVLEEIGETRGSAARGTDNEGEPVDVLNSGHERETTNTRRGSNSRFAGAAQAAKRTRVSRFSFRIWATDGAARGGTIAMERGEIRTPAFMPVGTAATVKAMRPDEVRASGADIILGNTYHLMLRPGAARVAKLGGLHKLMGWERPILTDSGGYQVMSLSELTKTSEEGVRFKSHLDGSTHMLTPERSIEVQRLLGSDVVMGVDRLVPTTSTRVT